MLLSGQIKLSGDVMAGLLGDIFSAGNVAKRKLTDLLGNPILSAQQMLGNLNDRARVLNEMTTAAAREGVSYGPSSQQLAGLLSEAYNPIGLTVFHGSPAKFQKFDPTKIGSGEGAQSYGYGHYVAESPDVAKSYAANVSNKQGTRTFAPASNAVQNSINYFKAMLKNEVPRDVKNGVEVSDDYIKSQIAQLTDQLPSVYKIDLPDEQIAKMLDWDKPLSKQPKNVQVALEKLGYKVDRADVDKYSDALLDALMTDAQTNLPKQPLDITGEALYRKLGNPEQAAQRLREAGIPGIRYLDQGSRGTGQGTSNFVVFPGNEDLLRILERNNQPLSLLD